MQKFYNLIPGQEGQESRLYIDGEIVSGYSGYDWWTDDQQTGAFEFRQELAQCGDVTVYINSPGGDVFAGAAMYSALLDHPHKVTVKIMGIAASAASVVAMAGDEVLISPVGYLMIHDPWSYVVGNAREMEHEAQVLREIGEGIVSAYQRKTGKTTAEIQQLLAAETYMNAQSAIENGFCDGLFTPEEDKGALSQASSPAATMRGRDYTPAAYMARMGGRRMNKSAERRVQSTDKKSGPSDGVLIGEQASSERCTLNSDLSSPSPLIAQALALVRRTNDLINKEETQNA